MERLRPAVTPAAGYAGGFDAAGFDFAGFDTGSSSGLTRTLREASSTLREALRADINQRREVMLDAASAQYLRLHPI